MKKVDVYLVRKTVKFKDDFVATETFECKTKEEAEKIVSRWPKGATGGGGWLGPEYTVCVCSYIGIDAEGYRVDEAQTESA
jgi:hypothetical protein